MRMKKADLITKLGQDCAILAFIASLDQRVGNKLYNTFVKHLCPPPAEWVDGILRKKTVKQLQAFHKDVREFTYQASVDQSN